MRVRLSGLSVHKLDRTTVAANLETTLHEAIHRLVADHRCPRGHWDAGGIYIDQRCSSLAS